MRVQNPHGGLPRPEGRRFVSVSCYPGSRGRRGREAVRLLADPTAARAFLRQDVPLWAWPLCTLGPREWPYVRLWVDDGDEPGGGTGGAGGASGAGGAGLWIFDHPGW